MSCWTLRTAESIDKESSGDNPETRRSEGVKIWRSQAVEVSAKENDRRNLKHVQVILPRLTLFWAIESDIPDKAVPLIKATKSKVQAKQDGLKERYGGRISEKALRPSEHNVLTLKGGSRSMIMAGYHCAGHCFSH
ncbi:hypothetical protein BDZ45DRAFT_734683 [Acephala macrosclerotiorum]|nr:hypothetical protein BDZ45DRAFT_734683 [Acephala macrosclerotiorum]